MTSGKIGPGGPCSANPKPPARALPAMAPGTTPLQARPGPRPFPSLAAPTLNPYFLSEFGPTEGVLRPPARKPRAGEGSKDWPAAGSAPAGEGRGAPPQRAAPAGEGRPSFGAFVPGRGGGAFNPSAEGPCRGRGFGAAPSPGARRPRWPLPPGDQSRILPCTPSQRRHAPCTPLLEASAPPRHPPLPCTLFPASPAKGPSGTRSSRRSVRMGRRRGS